MCDAAVSPRGGVRRLPAVGRPRAAPTAYAAPVVGVIVPVHGFAPYLAETLDCVLAQLPAPDEVVVVDDASPEPLVLHPDHAPHCTLL
ncbi:MAG: hypothetical protein QOG94_3835, partial [Solirubrobacteraceae bacterium]|nr:hypothetical protein [Solirubrobacteraceae bacterium]